MNSSVPTKRLKFKQQPCSIIVSIANTKYTYCFYKFVDRLSLDLAINYVTKVAIV